MHPATAGQGGVRRRAVMGRRGIHRREDSEHSYSLVVVADERSAACKAVVAAAGGSRLSLRVVDDLTKALLDIVIARHDALLIVGCIEETESLSLLRTVRDFLPGLPVIVVCDKHEEMSHAGLEAIRLGAQDFLSPSELSPELLFRRIAHAVERNRILEASRTVSRELEAAVAYRQREMEDANDELKAFNYMVSHDLRASLSVVTSLSQLLGDKDARPGSCEQRRILKRIVEAGFAMEDLLDSLLNLARADGSLKYRMVDLSELARQSYARLAQDEPEHQVRMVVQDGVFVRGDPRLFGVVIDNLVDNAWKFTRCSGSATIEFGHRYTYGEDVYFVRDDGPGFESSVAPLLFKPFFRGCEKTEGLGMGLATVERIVLRHGGRAWAEGGHGRGATFCFTIGVC